MAEWSTVFSISLLAFAAVLGGVAVGFWVARAQEQSAAGQVAAGLESPDSSADAASQASGTVSDELLAARLRLYLRVLQENGRPFETLAAVGVARGGGAKDDPVARRDALRAVSEAPARLRGLLPRVDVISSAEVAAWTRHLYHAWEACVRVLRESGTEALVAGDDASSAQEAWPEAYSALREELMRWNVESVYEHLREQMRSELGLKPDGDGDAPSFTPDELRTRMEIFASYVDRDE